jgi:hypothetical protein
VANKQMARLRLIKFMAPLLDGLYWMAFIGWPLLDGLYWMAFIGWPLLDGLYWRSEKC